MKLTNLREWRERRVLTQRELADLAGVSTATVNRLEQGLQDARISTVRKLAEALRVKPGSLFRERGTNRGSAK